MGVNKIDLRQSINRAYLSMIANKSSFNTNAYTEADNLMSAINSQLQPPFSMTPSDPLDRVLHIAANKVANTETSVRHAPLPASSDFSLFSGGTITFPASDGGTITGTSFSGAPVVNCPSGQYELVLIDWDPLSKLLEAVPGDPSATENAALLPTMNPSKLHIGVVVLHNTGGTIDNVTGASIVQFSGSGSQSGSFPFPITNNQVSPADIVGFLMDSSANKAFRSDYSIIRRNSGLSSPIAEDTTFATNIGTGANNLVYGVAYQSTGKMIVGGLFTAFNGNTRGKVVRLNVDGTEDTTFATNTGTGVTTGNIYNVYVDSSDRIYLVGSLSNFNGNTRGCIVRLNSDGTEDSTFATNTGTGANTDITDVWSQSDGSAIITGNFSSFNGNSAGKLARLSPAGVFDTTFNTNIGTGFGTNTNSLTIDSSDKILLGGAFTTFNGNTRNRFLRLNSDGTEDSAFITAIGTASNGQVEAITVDSSDDIYIGGNFSSFNGTSISRLAKINNNGTLNTSFNTNLGTGVGSSFVYGIAIDNSGKVLVVGDFTTFNGNTRNRMFRLNSDGTEESTFITALGTGFNSQVLGVAYNTSNGDVSVGGQFTTFDGNARGSVVRFNEAVTGSSEFKEVGSFSGVYSDSNTDWTLVSETYGGDDAGVVFSMTTSGQLQYTSSNLTGTVVESMAKFSIIKL